MPRGDKNRILDFPIPDFSKELQNSIAKTLSDLDAKIEVNIKINLELEAMAKLIYDYWFIQFDFPDTNGKPYKSSGGKMIYNEELKREIPSGWEVVELKNYLKSNRGVSYSSQDIDGEGKPMINLNSFNTNSTYKPEGIKSFSGAYNDSKVLKPLDLVMCNTQQTAINPKTDIIGKSFLVPDIFKEEIVSSHHITTIKVEKDNLKYYLNTLFNTMHFHRYISGYASGTNIMGLDFSGVLSYKAEIPNDKLLDKYKSIIVNVEKQKSMAIKENQKLVELRDWLLPMLMNGQVTVGTSSEKEEKQLLFVDPYIEGQRKIRAKKNAPKQAAIIALSIDAHDKINRNLYRTKGEKTVEVVEKHLNLILGRQPKKMAAGPAAFQHLVNVVEPLGKKFKWFVIAESERKGVKSHKYLKGENFEPFLAKAVKDFEHVLPEFLRVIDLFSSLKTTHEAEVYATTYSGWNNLIIRNEKITEETIVVEARENWHEKKLSIERGEFFEAIKWLKKHKLIPKGNGKEVL